MADLELPAFEAHLDTMIDQIGEESTELIIERPRYAHAVMVLASGNEPGELLTASRIKVLDPVFVPVAATSNGEQVLHHFSECNNETVKSEIDDIDQTSDRLEDGDQISDKIDSKSVEIDDCGRVSDRDANDDDGEEDDDDIAKALKKIEISRDLLNEPIVTKSSARKSVCCVNPGDSVQSKIPQYVRVKFDRPHFLENHYHFLAGHKIRTLYKVDSRRKSRDLVINENSEFPSQIRYKERQYSLT